MFGVEHAGFIVASYSAALLIVGGLIVRAIVGHRAAVKRLAALEAAGSRRRSEASR